MVTTALSRLTLWKGRFASHFHPANGQNGCCGSPCSAALHPDALCGGLHAGSAAVLLPHQPAARAEGLVVCAVGGHQQRNIRGESPAPNMSSYPILVFVPQQLTLGPAPAAQFEHIFVVGLPSRTDRRDGMVLQAALSHVQVEFIDGVLGKDVSPNAVPQTSRDERKLSPAFVGSWRAHMNAIHECVCRLGFGGRIQALTQIAGSSDEIFLLL
jgi:hypothetical protein